MALATKSDRKPWRIADAARAWTLSAYYVGKICREGKVPGAALNKEGPVPFWEIPFGLDRPILKKGRPRGAEVKAGKAAKMAKVAK